MLTPNILIVVYCLKINKKNVLKKHKDEKNNPNCIFIPFHLQGHKTTKPYKVH